MSKKYEEMTIEELGKEADKILNKFKEDIYGNASASIWLKNIDNLQQIAKVMKNCGIDSAKEKVDNILGGFLERNREYAISGNISNGISGNPVSDFLFPIDRQYGSTESVLYLKGNVEDVKSVNRVSIPYDEVMVCYEERDEYNQQMVYVILKNGMRIDFECVGIRI